MFHVKHSYHFSHDYLSETWPLPASASAWAAVRGARIFGGFLRFLTRYRNPKKLASRSRFAVRGSPAGEKLAGFAVRQRAGFSRRLPVAGAGVAVRCPPVAANFPEKLARRSRPAVRR